MYIVVVYVVIQVIHCIHTDTRRILIIVVYIVIPNLIVVVYIQPH